MMTVTRYTGPLYAGRATVTHQLVGETMTTCGVTLPGGNVTESSYWLPNAFDRVDCARCKSATTLKELSK